MSARFPRLTLTSVRKDEKFVPGKSYVILTSGFRLGTMCYEEDYDSPYEQGTVGFVHHLNGEESFLPAASAAILGIYRVPKGPKWFGTGF